MIIIVLFKILSTSLLFFIETNALNAYIGTRHLIIVDKKITSCCGLFKNDNIKVIMDLIFYNNLNHVLIYYS